jgi:hypothetical protein
MHRHSRWNRVELIARLAAQIAKSAAVIAKAIEQLSRLHLL